MFQFLTIFADPELCPCLTGNYVPADPGVWLFARIEVEPNFLSEQCDWVGETDFEIRLSPDESYFNEDFEM